MNLQYMVLPLTFRILASSNAAIQDRATYTPLDQWADPQE